MQSTRTTHFLVATSLVLAAGRASSVWAMQGEGATAPIVAPDQPQPGKGVRFNFKDAPLDMVLDVFARETGLPVIREAAAPAGMMTFISADEFSFEEALTILNLNLHTQGVHLRRVDGFLYLTTMKAAAAQPDAVFVQNLPEGVAPDQIVTITIPLSRAAAADIAEKVKTLVDPAYGSVTPFPTQNLLVVCETAAQAERIRKLVTEIDTREQIDSAYRLFPLRHAKAVDAVEALKGLVGQRVRQVIIDQNGQQRVVEEVTVAGLNIQPEPRTNSIIAVGPETRLRVVEELIALLDAPGAMRGGASLTTFELETITPEQAAQSLTGLFQGIRGEERPVVLPLSGTGKLALVAAPALQAQAMALLSAIDPAAGSVGQDAPPRAVQPSTKAEVVRLASASPGEVTALLTRLMSTRQSQVVRLAATPDQRSLIIAGPAADVDQFVALARGLDVAPDQPREFRQVRVTRGEAREVLARATTLFDQVRDDRLGAVSAAIDADARTITLVGSAAAVARFESILASVEQGVVERGEARSFTLSSARPSVIAPKVLRLAGVLLAPTDGSAYAAPSLEPMDELGTLVVRALPGQFTVIEDLIRRLDEPQPGERLMRVVRVTGGDPATIGARAMTLFKEQAIGAAASELGEVAIEPDSSTGTLVVRANAAGMRLYTDLLAQVQQMVPPLRTTRYIDVLNARASVLAAELRTLVEGADPIDPSRRIEPPSVRVIETTNSLVVTAEDAQHALVADLVRRLDRLETADLPPIRLLQLRASDSAAIAAMLTEQYGRRPQADRSARPVEVRADPATNTLIVSAHADLFDEIKTLVDELNRERSDGPKRETALFPLKVAKADAVAAAMDKLYPQPPVPVDRLNRPMPWLQQPKEVTVSADTSSNSLIIDAPAERIPSLQELAAKLDRVELPPVAELRTYRIIGANLDSIAQTLRGMAGQGIIQAPAQPGKPSLKVMIETEPRSSTLIVAGDATTFERVEQMLSDLGEVPVERSLRIVPIVNAEPEEVRARALEIYDAQIADIPGARAVTVTIDESSKALQVVADSEGMTRFMRVIDELQRQAGPAREVRMVELRFARAGEVVTFLRELVEASESIRLQGGPDPVLEPIETTNAILVAAQPSQLPIIEALAKGLDARQTAERPPLRILRVRSTDAANLASVLQGAFQSRPVEERARRPVDIQADAATNTLIVSAHAELLPEIEQIVSELNETQGLDEDGREIRIFPLRVARAEELALTIDQMFPQPPMPIDPRTRAPRPDLQLPKEVIVRADRATNSLIVDAPARRLAGFEQIVRSLDQTKLAESLEVRTYRVRRADLSALVSTIRNASSSGALGARTSVAPITVDAEPASRTLIVSGPGEIFEGVEEILSQVDAEPATPGTSVRIHTLAHARAERVAPMLQKILSTRLREQQAREGASPGLGDLQSLLDVSADRSTNALIISAPESVQPVAEEIIKALDTPQAGASARDAIRVVPLTFADADQVALALTQAMPTFDLPAGGPVSVLSARGANAILLTGSPTDLSKVEEVIASLDARPSDENALAVQTFALVHADAKEISPLVQNLLTDQQSQDPRIIAAQLRQSRGQITIRPTVRVEADVRTNSLVVSGPSTTVELARTIIDRLDQAPELENRRVATFTPARADPASLAASVLRAVNATTPPGRRPLELIPEPKTASLVVIGTDEQVSGAIRLLSEFDDRVPAIPAVDVRLFDLTNAQAAVVAPALAAMLGDRSRWPEGLRQAERAGIAVGNPTANADPDTNRVLVSAPTLLMPLAQELATRLDQPRADRAIEVRVFRLDSGDAEGVASALKAALSAGLSPGEIEPVVTPEPGSGCVVVAADPDRLARASEIVETLDTPSNTSGLGVRTVYLKNVRAEAIASVVERVLNKESVIDLLPSWQVGQYLAQGGDTGPQVRVAAEERLNALVISAPQGMLELAEQIARDLDSPDATGERTRSTRIITLVNADASELAASLEGVFGDEATEGGALPPVIRVDSASNSLIVRGDEGQLATVEQLAGQLDRAALTSQRQVRMITLDRSRADAAAVAETLRRLLEQQGGAKVEVISADELMREPARDEGPRGALPPRAPAHPAAFVAVSAFAQVQPGQPEAEDEKPVTIAVDPESNSLLIVGSPRLTERLMALAREIERQMPAEPMRVRIVELPEGSNARSIASLVSETTDQMGVRSDANPSGFTSRVRVGSDPSGSALLVWANDTDFTTVRSLVASIVAVDSPDAVAVKLIPLRNIDADAAARAVRDLLSESPRGVQAQRVRQRLELTLDGSEASTFDPTRVRVTEDPAGRSLVVAAPPGVLPTIDRFVAMLDQTPASDAGAIRRYALEHARASTLAEIIRPLIEDATRGSRAGPRSRIVADDRTNSLLVTGSEAQHAEIQRLLASVDAKTADDGLTLAIIPIRSATPSAVRRVVEEVLIGRDEARRERVKLFGEDEAGVLIVRASDEDIAHVRRVVADVDTELTGLPVRTIHLERADAQNVATAIQRFFRDRAALASRSGQRAESRVAITGDRQSGTLVVSASEEDYETIRSLAEQFDTPSPSKDMQLRIVQLAHARATDLQDTIVSLVSEMQWERTSRWRSGIDEDEEQLFASINERTNSVVLLGTPGAMEIMERIVADLDRPEAEQAKMVVRAVRVEHGDINAIASVIREVMKSNTNPWYWWDQPSEDDVRVQVDARRGLVLLVGKQPRVEQAVAYVRELSQASGREGMGIRTITLRHAQAGRAADSLSRFFAERSRAMGLAQDQITIMGSQDGNVLVVSGDDEALEVVDDLIAVIDQPELGDDRVVEVYHLGNADTREVASTIQAMYPKSGRADEQVIVTPQPSADRLIVSTPRARASEISDLIARLDAVPSEDEGGKIVTIALKTARASELSEALRAAIPASAKLRITPLARTNSVMLTGSDEAIALAAEQIAKLDEQPVQSPIEFARFKLRHAIASDVSFTVRTMMRARPRLPGDSEASIDYTSSDNTISVSGTADQISQLRSMIDQLDVPPEITRRKEFIKLEYAPAEQVAKALDVFYGPLAFGATSPGARNVQIVPDPATNSLLILAGESEWDGIRELLEQLDDPSYDTSRQLKVIPLRYADASSVARALNEGFQAPLETRLRQEQVEREERRRTQPDPRGSFFEPPVLVDAAETPSVSAEVQTNSLVVFAGTKDLERIEAIVAQLDVPDFAKLPPVHLIPLSAGRASAIAASIRDLYIGPGGARTQSRRSVAVIGDDSCNCVIVRAEEAEFTQIKALADSLQQNASGSIALPKVLAVRNVPAARLRDTIRATFQPAATQMNEVLAIEVDRASNALVIASSERLFEQIERVVRELDGALPTDPGAGVSPRPGIAQSVFIIDVQNNSPADVRRMLEDLGVTRPGSPDRPGVVAEPVTIVPLTTRPALAIVASAGDGAAITELVRALDAEPAGALQIVRRFALRTADATNVVATLQEMLKPREQQSGVSPAAALAEQVRRLSLRRDGVGEADLTLDLSKPIRLIAERSSNAVIVSSTEANTASIAQIVAMLDALPLGDAVVVRIMPLEYASADAVRAVVDELFRKGEALRRLPGTQRQGLPSTAAGQALAGEIAVSIDERTNALVVAGREEAVALVEVLVKELDTDQIARWVEPDVISLTHADAVDLARTLEQVLVRGLESVPGAEAMQRQVSRLRMLRRGSSPADPDARLEADLFAPLTGVTITPEENLNALIVVGSPANNAVIRELVSLLDVQAAGLDSDVRVYPLTHAAADRVAQIITGVMGERESQRGAREEDRAVLIPDMRTNAIVVSTSPRSFAIIEGLVRTLDAENANPTVGIHVVPVEGADAAALAPKIERLMRERLEAAARAGAVSNPMDAFRIEPEPASNALIVAASEENLVVVRELVSALATEGLAAAGDARTDLIQLRSALSTDIIDDVQSLYVAGENERRGKDAVKVLANERLNALVVTGSENDLTEIRRLVERLDSSEVASVREIKRIELNSADAIELVGLLQNVLAGRPVGGPGGAGTRQETLLRFVRDIEGVAREDDPEAEINGVIRDQVTLTPDLRTNSVIVTAPARMLALIEEIVRDLDTTSKGVRTIEKFRLENADARQMASLLRDIFNLQQQGSRLVLIPTRLDEGTGEPGDDEMRLTPVPDERQALAISIDARTNTLLVSGTDEYIAEVRKLVSELDQVKGEERTSRVIDIQYGKADEIAATVKDYYEEQAQIRRQLLGPDSSGSLSSQLEQEVTVIGDVKSNKVLISASPRYIDRVQEIVAELDAAPPQVLIQVLLAEVTLDSADDWGVDIRAGAFGGDGYTFGALAAGAGVATALGVPNVTVAADDFSLMVRALEVQGRLEVLSRPQVAVNNNERAFIQVGDNIAIVQGVERLDNGNTRADVVRDDVGILLTVTPSISADGFVRMEIQPEISTVSARTTAITADFEAPIISRRTIETVVTVMDGQTVVIGGLIQTTQEKRESRVPVLGSIPVLGLPFRSWQEADVKTELLVILTPRVIPGGRAGVAEFEATTDMETSNVTNSDRIRNSVETDGGSLQELGPKITWPRVKREVQPPVNAPDSETIDGDGGEEGETTEGEDPR